MRTSGFTAAMGFLAAVVIINTATSCRAHAEPGSARAGKVSIERGQYLVKVSGCNDCHTPGYAESGGNVPQDRWLMGSVVGYRGPWGTSYPSNLRLTVAGLSEDQWLAHARTRRLPPMPWISLGAMKDADLRSIYRFVQSLGADGPRAPAALPPGKEGSTPFILLVPQNLQAQSAASSRTAKAADRLPDR